jgi:hypothetical protein
MMLAIEPAGPSAAGQVGRVKDETTGKVRSLAADMGVRVVVRLGALKPAITVGVSNTAEVNKSIDGETPVISFTGYPVPVAIQNSSKDCVDETGIAAAKPYQLYALVVFENGRDPFGIPGLSGDILVSSNGTCKLTSPTWSAETLSFAFTASSPHFAPDGTTVNRGFYRAAIPINDAAMLFGITDPKVAATALDLVLEDTEAGSVSVEKRVAVTKPVMKTEIDPKTKKKTETEVKPSTIVISFTNFQYSSPKMTVKVKASQLAKYKKAQKSLVKVYKTKNAKNKR